MSAIDSVQAALGRLMCEMGPGAKGWQRWSASASCLTVLALQPAVVRTLWMSGPTAFHACAAVLLAWQHVQQGCERCSCPHVVQQLPLSCCRVPPTAPAVIYVAEAAQALCRNADYEIPFLKKQASIALLTIDCMPTQMMHCGNGARRQGDMWR